MHRDSTDLSPHVVIPAEWFATSALLALRNIDTAWLKRERRVVLRVPFGHRQRRVQ